MCSTMFHTSLKPPIIETIPLLRKSKAKGLIEAYGCSASMADSEMISGLLKEAGYEIATTKSESALNLIVTCSVKNTTEHRMVSRIRTMTKSGKPLIVAGCLPKADRAKVESMTSSASLLGPNCIDKAPDAVRLALSGGRLVSLRDSRVDEVHLRAVALKSVRCIGPMGTPCVGR